MFMSKNNLNGIIQVLIEIEHLYISLFFSELKSNKDRINILKREL